MLIKGSTKWQKTAEVLVVGYGAAGAAAAIAAQDEGAEVAIIEKQQAESHISNSHTSAGFFISPSNVKDAEEFLQYLCSAGEGISWTDQDVIKAWAEYAAENKGWMESLGAKLRHTDRKELSNIPGNDSIDQYIVSGGGIGFMQALCQRVASLGIPIIYGTQATKLLTNSAGEVVGVRVKQDNGTEANIRSHRAVILTCGGFEFNENMKLQYLKVYPTYFCGSPANTGDGIKMALDVGAELWHMNCCPARFVAKFPDFPVAFTMDFGGRGWSHDTEKSGFETRAGYIVVDRQGKRYTNENYRPHLLYYELTMYDNKLLQYPRVPSYWIFDRRRLESGPLPTLAAGPSGRASLYKWSQDNQSELRKGWLLKADGIPDLARLMETDSDVLCKTVENYNSLCRYGHDPEFGREANTLVPLDQPPFFAVKLYPGGPSTQGGPRRNRKAQLVNVDGEPIPRLYGAGELGSIYGMFYISGLHLAECIAFGRIAGRHAARENLP